MDRRRKSIRTNSWKKNKKKRDVWRQSYRLTIVADFDWDSLIIITPYANFDDTEENLGIDLGQIKHVNIESRDDINQLIFYKGTEPVRMVEYPRYPGDFASNKIQFIERDSAKFDVTVTIAKETGADWIALTRRK